MQKWNPWLNLLNRNEEWDAWGLEQCLVLSGKMKITPQLIPDFLITVSWSEVPGNGQINFTLCKYYAYHLLISFQSLWTWWGKLRNSRQRCFLLGESQRYLKGVWWSHSSHSVKNSFRNCQEIMGFSIFWPDIKLISNLFIPHYCCLHLLFVSIMLYNFLTAYWSRFSNWAGVSRSTIVCLLHFF